MAAMQGKMLRRGGGGGGGRRRKEGITLSQSRRVQRRDNGLRAGLFLPLPLRPWHTGLASQRSDGMTSSSQGRERRGRSAAARLICGRLMFDEESARRRRP